MRIMLTGCAGLVASWIAKGILESNEGHTILGIDDFSGGEPENLPQGGNSKDYFRFYQGDLLNEKFTEEIFASERPDVVYHCAAVAREGASEFQPLKIVKTNALMSAILLELSVKYKVKKFLFTSSMSVYGNQKPPFDETMRKRPVDPYGASKAMTEDLIQQLGETYGFEWVLLRPHNVIGTGQALFDPYRNVAGIFINRILRGESPLYIYGENHKRAFSAIEDCAPCLIAAITSKEANHQIINLGGREPITVTELANAILEDFNDWFEEGRVQKPKLEVIGPRPHETKEAFSTVEKSEKILGYKEAVGWRRSIKRMVAWGKIKNAQQWRWDKLPLLADSAPVPWRQNNIR